MASRRRMPAADGGGSGSFMDRMSKPRRKATDILPAAGDASVSQAARVKPADDALLTRLAAKSSRPGRGVRKAAARLEDREHRHRVGGRDERAKGERGLRTHEQER